MRLTLCAVIVFSFLSLGSTCNHNTVRNNVLSAHSTAREAFVIIDEYVASRYVVAGDACIDEVRSQNLDTIEDRMISWSNCMDVWNNIADTLKIVREILLELELVYQSIESGKDKYDDFEFYIKTLLLHARSISDSLTRLNISVPSNFMDSVTVLCNMVECEGEL